MDTSRIVSRTSVFCSRAVLLANLLVCITAVSRGQSQTNSTEVKLTASDGVKWAEFGNDVAIRGDYAIIGAHHDGNYATQSGAAYIFHRQDGQWSQRHKVMRSDCTAFAWLGTAVDIDTDYAVVGAPRYDGFGYDEGGAFVYRRDGTNWLYDAMLGGHWDTGTIREFGRSVAVSSNRIVVGVAQWGAERGHAFVYRRDAGGWVLEAELIPDDLTPQNIESFGNPVCIAGDWALVSATYVTNGIGTVYAFKRDGTNWSECAQITSGTNTLDQFGYKLGMFGDLAIVGVNHAGEHVGAAYVFKVDGLTWAREDILYANVHPEDSAFYWAVGISSNWAVVGDANNSYTPGRFYVFRRTDDGWPLYSSYVASDGAGGDYLGHAVAISDRDVIVGADRDDDGADGTGSAYLYRFPPVPEIDTIDLVGSNCWLDVSGVEAGFVCVVESSWDLASNSWAECSRLTTTGTATRIQHTASNTVNRIFYRVSLQ